VAQAARFQERRSAQEAAALRDLPVQAEPEVFLRPHQAPAVAAAAERVPKLQLVLLEEPELQLKEEPEEMRQEALVLLLLLLQPQEPPAVVAVVASVLLI
jgi:hypothetical protein